MSKKLLSIKELCKNIGVSRSTIYEWKKDGKLPEPSKVWGSPRYDWDKVEKALTNTAKVKK